jgi:hypothetical protein
MKLIVVPSAYLVVMASGAAILPRQLSSLLSGASSGAGSGIGLNTIMSYGASMMPGQDGIVTSAKPKLRTTAKRDIIKYGPITLPANKDADMPKMDGGHSHDMGSMGGSGGSPKGGSPKGGASGGLTDMLALISGSKPMDPNGFGLVKRLSTGMCKDCTVLSGKTDVVFENGTRADLSSGVYLHHVVAMDVSKPVPTFVNGCGSIASSFSPFLGGAVDGFTQYYTTPDGKFNSGYYIKDDTFIMQAELVNYRKEPQKVYIQMDIEYVPGKVGSDATQSTLAATECSSATQSFKPAKDTAGELKSQVYPVTKDGSIIAARGHMHDGGTSVNMIANGKSVCSSKATYGGTGSSLSVGGKEWQTITKMSECDGPIEVKKGDQIVISATYDTKNHPLRESHGEEQENMGIMTFVFVPKRS